VVPQSFGEVSLDQDNPEQNHADLVVLNQAEKEAIIVDVTIPLKGSLKQYKQHEIPKYINLAAWLKNSYDHVHLDAFVVGALG